ncbi:hypothetical protein BDD12DRAFT_882700 [Trichophaea hybrida]|nr:hypothetical protein BDD12DRAFT_882700 [Trichophaea hybrida]
MDISIDFAEGMAHYRVANDTLSTSSSLGWSTPASSTPIHTAQGSTQGGDHAVVTGTLGTIQDLIDLLSTLSIPGPLMLTDPLTRTFVGKGSQFHVYKNFWFESESSTDNGDLFITKVAVKKCIFKLTSDTRLDLSTDAARRQVNDMCLEIFALANPQLCNHRNIVALLGYSVDTDDWHAAPLLVQELAIGDLHQVLHDPKFDLSWNARHHLCLDTATALDASHAYRIAHGDLKPQNVLVFKGPSPEVPFVAKLADFGYSGSSAGDDDIQITGWTPGWCAPEIDRHVYEGASINHEELMKADNYSFGLVMWAVMCPGGDRTPPKSAAAAIEDSFSCSTMPQSLRGTLSSALEILMHPAASERPAVIGDILQDDSEACRTWNHACEEYRTPTAAATEQKETPSPFIHSWDIPILEPFMLVGLDKTFETYNDSLSGAQLFAMFLLKSYYDGSNGGDPTVQAKMLITAAERGFVPAQAVAHRVLQFHNLQFPTQISPETAKTWLFHGASTGSLTAAQDLNAIDTESCERARAEFRQSGGYNQFYSPTARPADIDLNLPVPESRDITDNQENSRIHELATYGCLSQLTSLLDSETKADINAQNTFGETGLYKACMAGSWETVSLLCRRGASASIVETLDGISCLHWLFNFPPEHIPTIARLLVAANGDPNILTHTTHRIIQYHFPFAWPPGTPLHWAVAASNITAVKVLLDLGADPILRNHADVYKSDRNIRLLDRHHQSSQFGSYSIKPAGCHGLNAIDLAVAQHDAEILELLITHVELTDLRDGDEEGYTPLHRLSSYRVSRTASNARFWYPTFLGAATDTREAIITQLTSSININTFTRPRNPFVFEIGSGGFTPLMLAVMSLDVTSVRALLSLGADIDVTNLTGYTVLQVLAQRQSHEPYTSPAAFVAIVNLFIKHYRRVNRLASEAAALLEVAVKNGAVESVDALIPHLPDDFNIASSLARVMVMREIFTRDGILTLAQRDAYLCVLLRKVDGADGGLLHSAARGGLKGCVEYLVSVGMDVDAVAKALDGVEEKKRKLRESVERGGKGSKAEVQEVLKPLEEVEGMLRRNAILTSKAVL